MENNLLSLNNKVFLNINHPAAQQRGLVFNQGDILRGLVQDMNTSGMARVLIQGQLIEATAEAAVRPGQNLHLLVEEVQPGRIILKILTPEALSRLEMSNLASLIKEMGITANENNLQLARSLLDHQLPVNRASLGQAAQIVQYLGENTPQNIATAALAMKYQLPVNSALLERLVSFFKADPDFAKVYQQLSRLIGQLPQVMESVARPGAELEAVRYAATRQPSALPTSSSMPTGANSAASPSPNPVNPTAVNITSASQPQGSSAGGAPSLVEPEAMSFQATPAAAKNVSQNLTPTLVNRPSESIALDPQTEVKGGTANPASASLTWPQSSNPEVLNKIWLQIQSLLENTMVRGDANAESWRGQLQQMLQSRPDLLKAWILAENILQNTAPADNIHPLREMLTVMRSLEHEISGQQIVNTMSRFSAETNYSGIYLAFPLKVEQDQYTMCELRLNQDRRSISRQDDAMQIAVSLDTQRMGRVLFHVAWKRAGTLDLQAVVETDSVRQFFLRNWSELSEGLEQLGYQVNNLGIKVVDAHSEMESLRPFLQTTAAVNIRPISIDITI
jgi:hypothetical protein